MRKILEEETNLKLVSVHPSKSGLVYISIFTAIHYTGKDLQMFNRICWISNASSSVY